ncbi:MAG: hypothetical protein HZB48_07600 [Actinobacteria bacterium]|nr:hypothetical protein [Actinomycetota bacterium]
MRLIDPLRRAFRWHRRGIAALLVAVAVLSGLAAVGPRSSGGVAVVIAARTVPGGATLTPSDLTVALLPPQVVPEGAEGDPGQLVGRTVVVDVPERQALTASVLLDGAGGVGPGLLALPVTFGTTGTVSLLRTGQRLDVLGASAAGSGFGVIAAGVRVVAIAPSDAGLLGGTDPPLVLLEVTSAQAAAVAAAMSVSGLSFALR